MSHTPPIQVAGLLGEGVIPADRPVALVDDLGLTRGHGCFDATRVRFDDGGAQIDCLDEHLARLDRSATALGIPAPDHTDWTALVDALCGAYDSTAEAALKLVLTGGGESSAITPVAYATLTEIGPETLREREGIAVATMSRGVASDAYADAPWLLGGVKTIAYATNLAAKHEAKARGADDALYCSTDGYALEAPTSALVVRHGDRLTTTPTGPTGVLASITIDVMARRAPDEGVGLEHALVRPEEIHRAEGAWFVSSVRGVAPIRTLDGTPLTPHPEGDALVRRLAGF